MGHSLGDGIIVLALAGALVGYLYFKYRLKQQRLEIIHQERLTAMDKGIPLPELPIDPPPAGKGPDQHVPLILGIILFTLGTGSMITLALRPDSHGNWPLPLPFAMMGLGLMLYHFLAADRDR